MPMTPRRRSAKRPAVKLVRDKGGIGIVPCDPTDGCEDQQQHDNAERDPLLDYFPALAGTRRVPVH